MSFVQVAYRTRVLEWVVLTAASRTDNAAIVLFAAILHPVPGELVRCLDYPATCSRPALAHLLPLALQIMALLTGASDPLAFLNEPTWYVRRPAASGKLSSVERGRRADGDGWGAGASRARPSPAPRTSSASGRASTREASPTCTSQRPTQRGRSRAHSPHSVSGGAECSWRCTLRRRWACCSRSTPPSRRRSSNRRRRRRRRRSGCRAPRSIRGTNDHRCQCTCRHPACQRGRALAADADGQCISLYLSASPIQTTIALTRAHTGPPFCLLLYVYAWECMYVNGRVCTNESSKRNEALSWISSGALRRPVGAIARAKSAEPADHGQRARVA